MLEAVVFEACGWVMYFIPTLALMRKKIQRKTLAWSEKEKKNSFDDFATAQAKG